MRLGRDIALARTLLARDWRAGELTLIGLALVIAVASVTTVGFFTDRVHRALEQQANQLLGADLVVASTRPVDEGLAQEAARRGLEVTRMLRFPSMVMKDRANLLASVKVIEGRYPLRGELRLAQALYGPDKRVRGVPSAGSVWVDERLFTQLGLAMGEELQLGNSTLRVEAIVTQEPDTAVGFINAGPRIFLNAADLGATGLIQTGSRVHYRLQIAGPAPVIEAYRDWAAARLDTGSRLEGIHDARPEIRGALERAEKFLNLAALTSVVLAAVAIVLAARRYLQRHLDGCAVMRCLGARQSRVLRLYFIHFTLLGTVASIVGGILGVLAQLLLASWLGNLVTVSLPAPGPGPAIGGFVTGLALLVGFALPPLASLGRVPTLRVLRRDLGVPDRVGMVGYALGFAVIAALVFWRAHDLRLGGIVLAGLVGVVILAGALVWLLLKALSGLKGRGVSWRFGIANLRRHALGSVIQIVALAVGIMALLTLTLIRSDLLQAWQASLPPDAPNRFLVNIQADQVAPLREFLAAQGLPPPVLHPMVRGRLTQLNGRSVTSENYTDERARRLVDREFNVSWAATMQTDNRIVAGRWWDRSGSPAEQFSMESGIAETLGVRLGDTLQFDFGGIPVAGKVTSLRKVDWDSFHVNFFVVAPPGLLDKQPASYITSFHLAPGRVNVLATLAKRFPNLLLIDVAQIMGQVKKMMDQVARAVQFVFLFTLLAGLTVLYAAIASTQDERLYQASIMRALGANRRQLARANITEFLVIGALAGIIAAAGSSILGYALAIKVLNLEYAASAPVWLIGILGGSLGIAAAGYLGTRAALEVSPLKVLRRIG